MHTFTLDALTRLQSALKGICQKTLLKGVLYYNLPVGVSMLLTHSTEREIAELQNRIAYLSHWLKDESASPSEIYEELRVIYHRILVTRDLLASIGVASNPIDQLLKKIQPWIPETEVAHDCLV